MRIATKWLSVPGIPAANRPWSFRVALTTDLILPTAVEAFKKKYPNVKRMVIAGDTKTAVTEDAVRRMWPQVLTPRSSNG